MKHDCEFPLMMQGCFSSSGGDGFHTPRKESASGNGWSRQEQDAAANKKDRRPGFTLGEVPYTPANMPSKSTACIVLLCD